VEYKNIDLVSSHQHTNLRTSFKVTIAHMTTIEYHQAKCPGLLTIVVFLLANLLYVCSIKLSVDIINQIENYMRHCL
jgi:hypothetical protein